MDGIDRWLACNSLEHTRVNSNILVPPAFDMRNPHRPLFTLGGHRYGVRRVRCSPHNGSIVASASYDFSVR